MRPGATGYRPAVELHSPAVIAERYAIAEHLGAGATSRVFRAHDMLLDRPVALKLLRPCDDATATARLRDEAVIASSLRHPGIARVWDYGEAEVDGDVRPYLAMELVEGMTLREVLRGGPLSPDNVLRLIAQVAEALAHAHAAGVVHRDVKPGNIILTPDGRAVLLDFGIARRADLEPLTLTGTIVGTVDYLSSEQACGHSATPLSDLYSLGCVAYEAATGLRPFKRETIMETVAAHASCEADPLPSTLPEALRTLIEQLVRRDPAQRPADAATVAALARRPELIVPAPLMPAPAEPLAGRRSRRARRARRAPQVRVASVSAAAAVASLAAVLLTGQIAPESSPAAAAGASSRPLPHTTAATHAARVAAVTGHASKPAHPAQQQARTQPHAGSAPAPVVAVASSSPSHSASHVAPHSAAHSPAHATGPAHHPGTSTTHHSKPAPSPTTTSTTTGTAAGTAAGTAPGTGNGHGQAKGQTKQP